MKRKMYVKMLDGCCWLARRKSQVGGSLASSYIYICNITSYHSYADLIIYIYHIYII